MLFKGFRFGMILQLAIGPMCIFIFQTSVAQGFWAGELGVLGTALIDSLEILLAVLGVGALLSRSKKAELVLKVFGVAILLLYGAVSVLSAFGISILPKLDTGAWGTSGGVLAQAVLLALSDPLTIVFWAGVFSAKLAEERFTKPDLGRFALGCVLATLFFLSLVSLAGSGAKRMIPDILIRALNFAVGFFMFYFAYRNLKGKA